MYCCIAVLLLTLSAYVRHFAPAHSSVGHMASGPLVRQILVLPARGEKFAVIVVAAVFSLLIK